MSLTWQFPDDAALTALLDRLNDAEPVFKFTADTTAVATLPLPFFDNYDLVRVTKLTWMPPGGYLYYIAGPEKAYALDGTVVPLHRAVVEGPFHLNESTLLDYVRLNIFCRIQDGARFAVVENLDDLEWIEQPDEAALAAIRPHIAAPVARPVPKGWAMAATLLHGTKLYHAGLAILSNGRIDVTLNDPLPLSLPSTPETRLLLQGNAP